MLPLENVPLRRESWAKAHPSDEKRLSVQRRLRWRHRPPTVSPEPERSAVERSAVAVLSWKCFSTERTRISSFAMQATTTLLLRKRVHYTGASGRNRNALLHVTESNSRRSTMRMDPRSFTGLPRRGFCLRPFYSSRRSNKGSAPSARNAGTNVASSPSRIMTRPPLQVPVDPRTRPDKQ